MTYLSKNEVIVKNIAKLYRLINEFVVINCDITLAVIPTSSQ